MRRRRRDGVLDAVGASARSVVATVPPGPVDRQVPRLASGASAMKSRITVVTIGVDDLERSVRFYRDGLGLQTKGIVGTEFEHGAVAFFDLEKGLKLALWARASLAHDSRLARTQPSATEFSLGHNVVSKNEVDAVMAQARMAGAVVVKPAEDTFYGGYAGYFQDPDGHLWEIAWNPAWDVGG